MVSCSMKRMRSVSFSLELISFMREKYSSMWLLALAWSIDLPMVVISLHRHSTSSSSGFSMSPSSLIRHSCMIFSVSIFCLYSWPMKLMLPSMRFLALMRTCSCSASFSFASSISGSASRCSCRLFSFSNSSWHLLSSSRLNVCGLSSGLRSSGNSGNFSAQRAHSMAYMWPKTGSKSALSKIMSMTSTMSVRLTMSRSRNCAVSFSNFSGVNLLSSALQLRSSFCTSSSAVDAAACCGAHASSRFSSGTTGPEKPGAERLPPRPPPFPRLSLAAPFW